MLKSLLGACVFCGIIGSLSPVFAEPVSVSDWQKEGISQRAVDLAVEPILSRDIKVDDIDQTVGMNGVRSSESEAWLAQNDESSDSSGYNPRQNYGYVSVGLGVGLPNNATADNVLLRVGNRFTTGDVDQSLSTGFSGELAAGYKYQDVRFELAVGYGSLNGSGGTINTTLQNRPVTFNYDADVSGNYVSVLVNGYYDIPTGSKWRPYLGAGVGYVNVSVGDTIFNTNLGQLEVVTGNSAGTFGYQGKLGLSYEVLPKGAVFGEAAYLGTSSYKHYSGLGVWRFALGWRQGF